MIYVYCCKECQSKIERAEKAKQPHFMEGYCPKCGAKDQFKRVLFPNGPPQIVYKGNPRGFAAKEEQQRKRYQEAQKIADGAYRQPSPNPISQDDDFWEASSEFDSYKPLRFGDPAIMSNMTNAISTNNITSSGSA